MLIHVCEGIRCVCFVPNLVGKTSVARGVFHDTVPREEAVFNVGRAAWLINALSRGDFNSMRYGMEDR